MSRLRFARGEKAWGHCMRCGMRFLLKSLVGDGQVINLQVCESCYDPPHPQERLVRVTDPIALKNATGDMDKAVANAPIDDPWTPPEAA